MLYIRLATVDPRIPTSNSRGGPGSSINAEIGCKFVHADEQLLAEREAFNGRVLEQRCDSWRSGIIVVGSDIQHASSDTVGAPVPFEFDPNNAVLVVERCELGRTCDRVQSEIKSANNVS